MPFRLSAIAFLLVCAVCAAAEKTTKPSPDRLEIAVEAVKKDMIYKVGEPIRFRCRVFRNSAPAPELSLRYTRRGDDGVNERGVLRPGVDGVMLCETKIAKPGFARLDFSVYEKGKLLRDRSRTVLYCAGVGAGLEQVEGAPEPKDFDAFWARQLAKLGKVPLKELEKKLVGRGGRKFRVYDVKIACAGERPVSGYLVLPIRVPRTGLPVEVRFQGYSENGVCTPPGGDERRILFQINAHGIENGFPPAYYRKKYGKGELNRYGFSGNETPEKSYFNGMLLRVCRAIEYVKTLPEWNRCDLVLNGGSQGGFQAVAGAALVPGVTQVYAQFPWLCDIASQENKRLHGWMPAYTPALAYYDTVNFGRRIKCRIRISHGLGDNVCPAFGVMALYNAIPGSKLVEFGQAGTHGHALPDGTDRMVFSQD